MFQIKSGTINLGKKIIFYFIPQGALYMTRDI